MPSTKFFSRRIEILDDCVRRRQVKWSVEALLETLNDKLNAQFDKTVSHRTILLSMPMESKAFFKNKR